jgi:hypothetical protein
MSRDPWAGSVGAPQSLDRYAYVAENPATATDPSGLVSLGPRGGPVAGTGKSKVLEMRDSLPCEPVGFFLGLGLLAGGSFRAVAGVAALGATGGVSSLASWVTITTGAAAAAAGQVYLDQL